MPRDGLDLDPDAEWRVEGDGALSRVQGLGIGATTEGGRGSVSVTGCKAHDTGRALDAILNDVSGQAGIDAVELLGGAVIAEGGWMEHASRERKWPDVSYGFGQPSVAWCSQPHDLAPSPDVRYRNADTSANRDKCRDYYWDAERALRYAAPRYAALRARSDSALDAWCRWNKPGIPPAENPNRAHYARSLAEAEQYRIREEPMYAIGQGVKDAMTQHGDVPRSDEEYHGTADDGGAQYSLTQGRDAQYRWTPADGVRRAPFE